uniref:Protein tyrosine phosphatase receptor type N n=1 Tax=Myotis myotis TaxID=51298 RepID=A0A7J7WIW1_MYOMY|nr:protein tyrosine phosphatase receptor type N [Myotis myotis]
MRRPRRPGGPGGSGGLRVLLCLLLLSCRPGGCSAISAHGCLFDRRLCSHLEVCIQDGLFGQCQVGVGQARPLLQVTSPVLQRLQGVLRQLMSQGLSWHDDLTQYVISQEMERIPRLRPPEPHPRDRSALVPRRPGPAEELLLQGIPTRPAPAAPHRLLRPPAGGDGAGAGSSLSPLQAELLPPLLENLLLSPQPPHPALSYEATLLQPYLFHQFGSRDGSRDSESSPGMVSVGPLSKAEPPALFSRTTPKGMFGAHPGHSYGDPPGPSPAQLFQESGLLYLAQELPVPSRARAPNLPAQGDSSQAEDSSEGYEEEGLEGLREKPPSPAEQPDVTLQRLAAVLAGYKVELRQLTPEQLSTLSTLLQLLPKGAGRNPGGIVNIGADIKKTMEEQVQGDAAEPAPSLPTPSLPGYPTAHPTSGLVKSELEAQTGLQILQTGVGQREEAAAVLPRQARSTSPMRSVLLTLVALVGVAGLLVALAVALCVRQHARKRDKERLAALGPEGAHGDTTFEYQDLCRQHMATKSLFSRAEGPPEPSRVSSVSSQFSDAAQASPSSHSSTPSWCEEPAQANMDISTGHMILAYMEDHLRNRDRLAQEWQALCAYQAEPNTCATAQGEGNIKKNRHPDFLPYDHARIKLKVESSPSRSDYINASPIIEHDPRMPAYIATQGPLSHTIADFWQMVWESGCTVIVMLTPLVEDGVKQCDRYWPDEGSSLYHIYEVNLVSEHIWCEDFLVRSFYLKNVQTQETRTLTQFHFLSWPAEGTPASTRPLLDFRRKVNKCYRGRSCPIIVHCSDGAGRTGTYVLIDMVLNRMAKGVKEIDIAATLEHVRDQRPGLVRSKDQFEFALTAVAEEVNAILKALPQ